MPRILTINYEYNWSAQIASVTCSRTVHAVSRSTVENFEHLGRVPTAAACGITGMSNGRNSVY